MVRPGMLWNFIKTCDDTAKVGRVCRILGRQLVPEATADERLIAQMIDNDSIWMEEHFEEKRRKDRERKRKKTTQTADLSNEQPNANPQFPADSTDSVDSTDSGGVRGIRPYLSIYPSIYPSNKNNKTDSESDSDNCSRTAAKPPESDSESDSVSDSVSDSDSESVNIHSMILEATKSGRTAKRAMNPWRMPDEEILYSNTGIAAILRKALGDGGWREAVRQAGEEPVRELFLAFRNEVVNCGEGVRNPASAFTARLKRDLGVDFSRSETVRDSGKDSRQATPEPASAQNAREGAQKRREHAPPPRTRPAQFPCGRDPEYCVSRDSGAAAPNRT